MKLFLSDLHIGDGNLRDDFKYDHKLINILEKMENESNPEINIVGDFIEIYDLSDDFEMKGSIQSYIDSFDYSLLDKIENEHSELFETFKKISRKVKIRYIVGNHDYYLLFDDAIKKKVENMLGNVEILPYHYDETIEVMSIHGNQFDSVNRIIYDEEGKLIPSFGEYLLRYMNNNFNSEVSDILPDDLVSDYDNISPLLDVFEWLEHINKRYSIGYDLKNKWAEHFVDFIKTSEIKKWLKINYPKYHVFTKLFINNIGGLEMGQSLVRLIMFFRDMKKSDALLKRSKKLLKENFYIPKKYLIGYSDEHIEIPDQKIKGLIMGHNHKPSFNVITKDKVKKFYANTGAWKHTVTKNTGINNKEFIRKTTISYLLMEESNKNLDVKLHVEQLY
ncbi:MAG: UDP-2,3-diacylglucosamine hydrolase [Thermotogota bacterium]